MHVNNENTEYSDQRTIHTTVAYRFYVENKMFKISLTLLIFPQNSIKIRGGRNLTLWSQTPSGGRVRLGQELGSTSEMKIQ